MFWLWVLMLLPAARALLAQGMLRIQWAGADIMVEGYSKLSTFHLPLFIYRSHGDLRSHATNRTIHDTATEPTLTLTCFGRPSSTTRLSPLRRLDSEKEASIAVGRFPNTPARFLRMTQYLRAFSIVIPRDAVSVAARLQRLEAELRFALSLSQFGRFAPKRSELCDIFINSGDTSSGCHVMASMHVPCWCRAAERLESVFSICLL